MINKPQFAVVVKPRGSNRVSVASQHDTYDEANRAKDGIAWEVNHTDIVWSLSVVEL